MSDDDKKVVFRRVHGRIVPIKVTVRQPPKSIAPEDIATAFTNATVTAGAVFGATMKASNRFATKAAQAQRILRNFSKTAPAAPALLKVRARSSAGRFVSTALKPDIFEIAKYRKQLGLFTRRTAQLGKIGTTGSRLAAFARITKKVAIPAAVILGLASGFATLSKGVGSADD